MGQAKRRGTFEERRALATELAALEKTQSARTMAEIRRRRPSPKHMAMMGIVAALMQPHNAKVNHND